MADINILESKVADDQYKAKVYKININIAVFTKININFK